MIYDLNDILITPRIHSTWLSYLPNAVAQLQKKYPDLSSSEVPDEQFRVLPNGNGQIFVSIRNTELKLNAPKSEFQIK